MSGVYRAKFLQNLKQMIDKGEVILLAGTDAKPLFNLLYHKDWIVYAKAPFGGPQAVIEYLAGTPIKWLSAITEYTALMMKKQL